MRRLSCLIALLACLVLALPAFAAPQKADAISGISSEKVLDIVKANKGKLVFINFFATWCPPCREEIPELISIRKAYPADKVVDVYKRQALEASEGADVPISGPRVAQAWSDRTSKAASIRRKGPERRMFIASSAFCVCFQDSGGPVRGPVPILCALRF